MTSILEFINTGDWDRALELLKTPFDRIFGGKTLFHYACMRGNEKIIDHYVQLKSDQIYKSDDDGNTGFHLLAINEFDSILLNIVDRTALKLKNNNDNFVYDIVFNRLDTFRKIVKLMVSYKLVKYLEYVKSTGKNIVLSILDAKDSKYLEILLVLHKNGLDFEKPEDTPPLVYAIYNKYLDSAKFLIEKIKVNINVKTYDQITPLILSISKDYEDFAIYLLEFKDIDINFSGLENKFVPLSMCFKKNMMKLANKMIQFESLDFNKKDNTLSTPIYYLIEHIHKTKTNTLDGLLRDVIKKSDMTNVNIDNVTPFHLLVEYGLWKKYKDILEKKVININSVNKNKKTPVYYVSDEDTNEFVQFVEKTIKNKKIPKIEINDVILPQTYTDGENTFSTFNADGMHNIIYLLVMLSKYPNLTIPMQCKLEEKQKWYIKKLSYSVPQDPTTKLLHSLASLYYHLFFCVVPSIIIWNDKYTNFKNDDSVYLQRAINSKGIRFVIMRISLIIDSSTLHANILVYDKDTNKLMRFEPYGFISDDTYHLDSMIVELFKKSMDKQRVESLKYIRPHDFLDKTKFQTASKGDDFHEKNLSDPSGFCLAWCFWFLELKIANPDIDENVLVEKALDKIIMVSEETDTNPLLTHIRSYARYLDKEKNSVLKNIGFNKHELYRLSYSSENMKKITDYIDNFFNERNNK